MVHKDDGSIDRMKLNKSNEVLMPETVHSVQTLRLKVTLGPENILGTVFDVGGDEVTIGSAHSNAICIPLTCGIKGVSPIHAKIDRRGEHFWLQDLSIGNMHGTRVVIAGTISGDNSVKIKKRRTSVAMKEGDIFVLGPSTLVRCVNVALEPSLQETWEYMSLQITRLRTSRRSRRYPTTSSHFNTTYCLLRSDDDTYIGRNIANCDVSVKDYDLNGVTACISQPHDEEGSYFYLENLTNSKRKGVFLLLGRNPAKFDTDLGDDGQEARDDRTVAYDIRRHSAKRISVGGLYLDESQGDNIYDEMRESELVEGDVIVMGRTQLQVVDIKVEGDSYLNTRRNEHTEYLKNVDIFSNMSEEARSEIASSCIEVVVPEGSLVVRQGDTSVDLYFILSGEVEVYKEYDSEFVLAELGEGKYFGEMCVLSSYPASASVRTKPGGGDVKFLILDHFRAKSLLSVEAQSLINILVQQRVLGGVVRDLQRMPFIQARNLPVATLEAVAVKMRNLSFQPREDIPLHIIRGAIIIVTQGALRVLRESDATDDTFSFALNTASEIEKGTLVHAGEWLTEDIAEAKEANRRTVDFNDAYDDPMHAVEAEGITRLICIRYSKFQRIVSDDPDKHKKQKERRTTLAIDARHQTRDLSVTSVQGMRRISNASESDLVYSPKPAKSPSTSSRRVHPTTRESLTFSMGSQGSVRSRASSRFLTVRKRTTVRRRSKVNSLAMIQSADEGEERVSKKKSIRRTRHLGSGHGGR